MFKPPSLQREYELCSSLDPALDLPVPPVLAPDASPDEIKLRDELAQERANKFRVARERGEWHRITKSGELPTLFRFRSIHGPLLTWLQGESQRRRDGRLSMDEVFELAFRLALRGIENFGVFKVAYETIDGHSLATFECLAPVYDLGRDAGEPQLGRTIVLELGAYVFERAVQGVPPLS